MAIRPKEKHILKALCFHLAKVHCPPTFLDAPLPSQHTPSAIIINPIQDQNSICLRL